MDKKTAQQLILEHTFSLNKVLDFIYQQSLLLPPCPKHIELFAGFNTLNFSQYLKNHRIISENEDQQCSIIEGNCIILPDFLNISQTDLLKNFFHSCHAESMSLNNVQKSYGNSNDGIKRVSVYDIDYSWFLFKKLLPFIPLFKIMEGDIYIAIQLNPLLRFIEYQDNNSLVPHVDSPVQISSDIVTFSTALFYLTNNFSGYTRFLLPNQSTVEFSVKPQAGKTILFDHNIVHDSENFIAQKNEENKLVITTEVAYYKLKNSDLIFLLNNL